jgi:Rieske Fe-S protein
MEHHEASEGAERRRALRWGLRVALAAPLAMAAAMFMRAPRRAATRSVAICPSASLGPALRVVSVAGMRLGLRRQADGSCIAFDMACTHAGCLVEPTKTGFLCPCHGGMFTADGAPAGGPVRSPLRRIAVQDVDGMVVATVGEA